MKQKDEYCKVVNASKALRQSYRDLKLSSVLLQSEVSTSDECNGRHTKSPHSLAKLRILAVLKLCMLQLGTASTPTLRH